MAAPTPAWLEQLFARPFDADRVARVLYKNPDAKKWFEPRISNLWPVAAGAAYPVEDFIREVLVRLYEKLRSGEVGCDHDREKPSAWLCRIIMNLAIDLSRELRAQKRMPATLLGSLDEVGHPHIDGASPELRLQIRHDARRAVEIMIGADLPATQRVAFLGWYAPWGLEQDHVAAGETHGNNQGFLRPIADSWPRLQDLAEAYPEGVADDDRGRSELAFILRSNHPGPHEEWEQSCRDERTTAMDTVRVWQTRAMKVLKRQIGGES